MSEHTSPWLSSPPPVSRRPRTHRLKTFYADAQAVRESRIAANLHAIDRDAITSFKAARR